MLLIVGLFDGSTPLAVGRDWGEKLWPFGDICIYNEIFNDTEELYARWIFASDHSFSQSEAS
jgi:hypothetical protein